MQNLYEKKNIYIQNQIDIFLIQKFYETLFNRFKEFQDKSVQKIVIFCKTEQQQHQKKRKTTTTAKHNKKILYKFGMIKFR